jgi:hypothetical protein
MSGFCTSAARLGAPDTGLISYYEMMDQVGPQSNESIGAWNQEAGVARIVGQTGPCSGVDQWRLDHGGPAGRPSSQAGPPGARAAQLSSGMSGTPLPGASLPGARKPCACVPRGTLPPSA